MACGETLLESRLGNHFVVVRLSRNSTRRLLSARGPTAKGLENLKCTDSRHLIGQPPGRYTEVASSRRNSGATLRSLSLLP